MRDSAWIPLPKEAAQNGAEGGGILACFYLAVDTVSLNRDIVRPEVALGGWAGESR